jgi:hypothetical protein
LFRKLVTKIGCDGFPVPDLCGEVLLRLMEDGLAVAGHKLRLQFIAVDEVTQHPPQMVAKVNMGLCVCAGILFIQTAQACIPLLVIGDGLRRQQFKGPCSTFLGELTICEVYAIKRCAGHKPNAIVTLHFFSKSPPL